MSFLVNYFTVTVLTLLIKIVCLLVTIAYYTLAERKIMASVQRRLGPNVVGFWGLLQPVSDGLKLFGKELVIPIYAKSVIFIGAPIGVLLCAFLGWSVVPFHLFDHSVGMPVATVRECLICGIGLVLATSDLKKRLAYHRDAVALLSNLYDEEEDARAILWHENQAEYLEQLLARIECYTELEIGLGLAEHPNKGTDKIRHRRCPGPPVRPLRCGLEKPNVVGFYGIHRKHHVFVLSLLN